MSKSHEGCLLRKLYHERVMAEAKLNPGVARRPLSFKLQYHHFLHADEYDSYSVMILSSCFGCY
jgi:hypothetical protein